MPVSLTKKQRQLQKELDAIAKTIGVDYWNILNDPPEVRTPLLRGMMHQMIR